MSVPPAPNSQPMSATSSASGSSSRPRNSHRNSSYGSQTGSSSQSASSSLRNTAAYKRQNSINTIESSVTKLLVATKKLLECLKQWASGDCTEKDVSDVYVSLGNEFNITSRAFVRIGIDVSDFDDVPGKLRTILEEALARERSQATVDVYTPAIRQIIVKLLEGLKEKQALLRTLMAQQHQQQQVQQPPQPTFSPVSASGDRSMVHRSATSRSPTRNDHTVPTRSATIQYPQRPADPTTPTSNPMPPPHGPQIYPGSPKRNSATYNFLPSAASPVASARPESSDFPPPVDLPPNPTTAHPSSPQAAAVPKIIESVAASPAEYASYSHQTPTQSNDPRAQLQRSDALERRASRRFSAYQYAKLGASGPGGPTAAGAAAAAAASEFTHRSRGSSITNGSVSTPMTIQEGQVLLTKSARSSANGKMTTSERYSLQETDEEQAENEGSKTPSRTSASLGEDSKMAAMAEEEEGSENGQSVTLKDPEVAEAGDAVPTATDILKVPVFIQLDRKIKKVWLDADDVSLAALRLLFVERFSYSPGSENFPAMSIQDKETGVKYDLDETTIIDITRGSLIILNVDTVDETKKALEDGMTSLLAQFAELQVKMVAQADLIAKMAESQQTSAAKLEESIKTVVEKEMAKATALTSTAVATTTTTTKEVGSAAAAPTARRPPITPSTSERSVKSASPKPVNQVQLAELASLRKDLAAVRQIHGGMTKTLESSLSAMKSKIAESSSTQQTSIVVTGDKQVTQYHNILSTDIDSLLTKVEDLQDVIEALRKDVALRGVRPLPRQLEAVAKDLAQGRTELRRLEAYVKKEKPLWKKILERELDNIVEEQQFFTLQEDLLGDLLEDLESAAETFSLVQQFTEEQIKISASSKRAAAPFAGGMGGFDAVSGKDAVLREVRALNPNHESRLEAIERAEKVRQLENKSRGVDEFEKELGEFVEEGKLKKSGGIEEVERQRKLREEQVWKEWSENSMAMGMGML